MVFWIVGTTLEARKSRPLFEPKTTPKTEPLFLQFCILTSLLPTVSCSLFCSQPSQEKVDSFLAERKKLRKQQHDLNVTLKHFVLSLFQACVALSHYLQHAQARISTDPCVQRIFTFPLPPVQCHVAASPNGALAFGCADP